MNEDMRLERMLTGYLASESAGRVPERLIDETLTATGRLRPDPRWLALLKEPPMRTQTRVVVGMPTRRLVLALLAAAVLLLAIVGAIAGTWLLRPPALITEDWPMFRGDATRIGLSLHGPIGRPVVRWQYHAQGGVAQNLSIVGDLVYVPTDSGFIDAIGVADGVERWSRHFDSGPIAGPIVADGQVVVRDGSGVVYGLDAITGTERWHSTGRSPGVANAALGDGAIFVGSDTGLAAYDVASGVERWRTALGHGGAVNTTAYADGLVYAATASAGFFAVDARTGTTRWQVDVGDEATGTPVVNDGIAYIGAGPDVPSGHLRAIDAKTGKLLWRLDEPIGSPSIVGGVAYASAPALAFEIAFDPKTGAERWRVKFPGGGTARAPAIADGVVYVPQDGEHRVYALDAQSGGELWHFDLDSGNSCCLAVVRDSVFVGTDFGTVYRIGGDGSTVQPVPIVARTPAPTTSPVESTSTAQPLARFAWRASGPGEGYMPHDVLAFDPSGRIWMADQANSRFAIFSADATFVEYWGKPGSRDGEFDLRRANGDGYGGIAFAPDGSFYVLDVGNRRVQEFDAQRRFIKAWGTFGTGPGMYSDPIGIAVDKAGTVYVLDDHRRVVEWYDPDGHVRGSLDAFSNPNPGTHGSNGMAVDADGNVYVGQIDPNQVVEFDRTGKILATYGLGGPDGFHEQPNGIAIDHDGRVYVAQGPQRGSAPGVLIFDRGGGYLGGFGPPGLGDGELFFPTGILVDDKGGIYIGEAADGDCCGGVAPGGLEKFTLLGPLAP